MPFDGAFTRAIVKEISNLKGARVDKIHQPTKDDLIINLKKDKINYKLLLSSNPSYPRIQITNINKENPQTAPNFVMVLRKYLQNSRLEDIKQINFDRIVEIKFEGKDELGYSSYYYIIIEIMGKHSNIILLDEKYKIIDAIKHLGSDMNRYRLVLPGVDYVFPPNQGRINPLEIDAQTFENLIVKNPSKKLINFFSETFLGLSKQLSAEICKSFEDKNIKDLSDNDKLIIKNNFFYFLAKIKSNDFLYILYSQDNRLIDYYIFDLENYKNYQKEILNSPSELLDKFYNQKDIQDTLKHKYSDLIKLIKTLLEKNIKKIEAYNNKISECQGYENFKIYADILMANQYSIKSNQKEISLPNFYDKDLTLINIPLNENLNAVENAQEYYKKYAKYKATTEILEKQLKEALQEKEYLEGILYSIENANDIDTLEEIKHELMSSGYLKQRKNTKKQIKSAPHHYISSDGFDIYVGKNNIQNDYLTLKFANKDDIWLHTKNIPGSHVIIKSRSGFVSEQALLEAAYLAAYYSKGKNSTNVPVDWTSIKNVKKPSGAKPGMVIYYTNRTIYVTPDELKIKNLKKIE
ncbi:NFACT RNA binding domain-containing protein [Caloramator sp. CAR-1]|uniref:Rqc2 family fibronectin-binding protein n=1 Tax=Caloramator sp. CAR-1 TaxID=3062777 RepID=UPI0026E1901F|nr:NFACT RNA binding domain-containing protein [Caloramator sp. CAR-1]MDO6354368.1 NFACT RNA binding domain-containing protein [Caloramator sp. CAR-1]